jgi:hypothetical protein
MIRIHAAPYAKTTSETHQISNVVNSHAENELFRPSLSNSGPCIVYRTPESELEERGLRGGPCHHAAMRAMATLYT